MTRFRNPWTAVAFDCWSLAVESSAVIGLRTMKLAMGGSAADAESRRMVSEKLSAGLQLQSRALTGGLGLTPDRAAAITLKHYRRRVRANQRRLTKG